jgi:hypothetical protein
MRRGMIADRLGSKLSKINVSPTPRRQPRVESGQLQTLSTSAAAAGVGGVDGFGAEMQRAAGRKEHWRPAAGPLSCAR